MGSLDRLTREYSTGPSVIGRLSSGWGWRAGRTPVPHRCKGPDAGFYKGLIQVAAGCLHYGRRNRRGAVNKWTSGAGYLRPYLPAHKGVGLVSLVKAVDGYLAAMQGRGWPELNMPTIAQE